ncbi:hypothetical protein ACQRBP_10135 [Eubacteriales bacterium SGI.150]
MLALLTIERAFIDGRDSITTEDIQETIKDTKSISDTLKAKIEKIKEAVEKMDIRPASQEDVTTATSSINKGVTSYAVKQ